MGPAAVCVIAVVAFIVLMIVFGIGTVGNNSVGLNYNKWSVSINEEVVGEGIHYIWPLHKIIEFQLDVQYMSFEGTAAIQTRTKDGLDLTLTGQLSYKVQSDNVYDLYNLALDDYESLIYVFSRDTIRDVAANYSGQEWMEDLTTIQTAIEDGTKEELSKFFISVEACQMTYDLPEVYEEKLNELSIMTQQVQSAEQAQQTAITQYETDVLTASINADSYVIQQIGEAQAEATVAQGEADAAKTLAAAQ
ncbi:stomatin family protein, partial [Kipferlia bialata]|eukprot:g9130.t1